MRLIEINNASNLVTVDGVTLKIAFDIDDNIKTIYWDESVKSGFIEVKEGNGQVINSLDDYAHILTDFQDKINSSQPTDHYFRIICDDNLVDVNGDAFEFDFDIDANYHAVHWDGSKGFIETKSGINITLVDLAEFADIIEAHGVLLAEKEAEKEAADQSRQDYLASWDYIRDQRASIIAKSDWTQLDDSPLKGNQAWLDYRQALRDITETFDSPVDVVWPIQP